MQLMNSCDNRDNRQTADDRVSTRILMEGKEIRI